MYKECQNQLVRYLKNSKDKRVQEFHFALARTWLRVGTKLFCPGRKCLAHLVKVMTAGTAELGSPVS